MDRQPVRSSWLASVGYDPSTRTLEIELRDASVYVYQGVPSRIYSDLLAAPSKGRYVLTALRAYPYQRQGQAVATTAGARMPADELPDSKRPAATEARRTELVPVFQARPLALLELKYGPLFEEVKRLFLSMPRDRLAALLADYAELYGEGACRYATNTIPLWRAGATKISGKTMTRLLDLVPRHLDQGSKYILIEKLRQHTLARLRYTHIRLRMRADDGSAKILDGALSLIKKQLAIELPTDLYELGGWITAQDAELLQKLVIETERQAMVSNVADLILNVALLRRVRTSLPHAKLVRATFEVPTASLEITILKPRNKQGVSMPESDTDLLASLQRAENDHAFQSGGLPFQTYVIRNMDHYFTQQQQTELRQLAAKQAIDLDKLKAEVLIRGQTSSHDMQELLKFLETARSRGQVADVNAEYQTPSGRIQIKAKSQRFGCVGLLVLGASLCASLALVWLSLP